MGKRAYFKETGKTQEFFFQIWSPQSIRWVRSPCILVMTSDSPNIRIRWSVDLLKGFLEAWGRRGGRTGTNAIKPVANLLFLSLLFICLYCGDAWNPLFRAAPPILLSICPLYSILASRWPLKVLRRNYEILTLLFVSLHCLSTKNPFDDLPIWEYCKRAHNPAV